MSIKNKKKELMDALLEEVREEIHGLIDEGENDKGSPVQLLISAQLHLCNGVRNSEHSTEQTPFYSWKEEIHALSSALKKWDAEDEAEELAKVKPLKGKKTNSVKTKKIIILEYPQDFSFETNVKLPEFNYGCKVRGKLLLSQLKTQNVHSPSHAYEDYLVENITKTDNGEIWHLGS